jgi:hypothetical protein
MGKGQTYWALSKQPADGYTGGMSPTVYLSRDAQALENLRTNWINKEKTNHTQGPQVYQIDRVYVDELRGAMIDQRLEAAARGDFGPEAKITGIVSMAPTGFQTDNQWSVIVGKDYLHPAVSNEITTNPVIAVQTLMQQRDKTLVPFREAADRTNPYKMLDSDELARPETKEAMMMAYTGQGVDRNLYPAVSMMAKNGLDTAEMVPDFQKAYEKHMDDLSAKHPEWGRHQLQNEALTATAWEFQTQHCGNDMRQQGVFQFIAGQSRAAQQQCAMLDSQERDQAFSYATQEISAHLQQNGQGIEQHAAQGFRNRVMMTVGERVNREGFSQAMVQGAIKDVAAEFAKGVQAYGDKQAGVCFENIAGTAEYLEGALEDHDNMVGENELEEKE